MNAFLLIANWVAVVLIVLARLRRRPAKMLDPAWALLAGYAINYCVRPTLFVFSPELSIIYTDYYAPEFLARHFKEVLLFAMLGLLGFAAGDLQFGKIARWIGDRLPSLEMRAAAITTRYSVTAFVFLVLGGAGLLGFVQAVGWRGSFLLLLTGQQRDTFLEIILGHGYYTLLAQLSILGWTMICVKWIAFPKVRRGLRRWLIWMMRGLWFGFTLLIWVAFGERSSILAVLFIPLALYFTLRDFSSPEARRQRRKVIAVSLAVVLVGTLIAGPIGLLMKGRPVTLAGVVLMATSAWDAFELTAAALAYVPGYALLWGSSYVGDLFYTWLPRAMFPEKPLRYGAMVVQDVVIPELRDNLVATFPTGILVEAYVNFWYFGVFLVPFVAAIACKAIYFRLCAGDWFWLVQIAFLFPNLASFRGLGGSAALLIMNVVILGLAILICRGLGLLNYCAIRKAPAQADIAS